MRRARGAAVRDVLLTLLACVVALHEEVAAAPPAWTPTAQARASLHARLTSWAETHARGWAHLRPRQLGNFWTERWCGEAGPACDGGAIVHDPRAAWFDVAAIVFDGASGVAASAGRAGPRCSARLSLTVGGASLQADGVSVTLRGPEDLALGLGDALAVTVGEDLVRPDGVDGVATLAALLASPDQLRVEAERQVDLLAAAVDAALDAGTVQGCVYGPYLGGGVPPECTRRPLTPDEVSRERLSARARRDAQRAFLADHAGDCHDVLTTLAAPDLPALLSAAR